MNLRIRTTKSVVLFFFLCFSLAGQRKWDFSPSPPPNSRSWLDNSRNCSWDSPGMYVSVCLSICTPFLLLGEYGHGVSAQWKTCLRSFDCGDWTEGSAARFCVGEVCEGWINSVIQLPVMAYNCVTLGQLFCSSASTCSEYNNFCLGFAWCTDELRLRV